MKGQVRQDILRVLKKTIDLVKKKDYAGVLKWSDHVIRNASTYQDDDSLTVAVFVYSLGKVLERCTETDSPVPRPIPLLKKAAKSLEKYDFNTFHVAMKDLLQDIGERDKELKMYIQHVIEKAKVKKASRIHKHGISIARTSELLGVSQWELQDYIGQTVYESKEGVDVLDRLEFARGKLNNVVVDAGPIITITANHILWLFARLKEKFVKHFLIPIGVKQELVDKPLMTRRFKLEAIQVQSLITSGVFEVVDNDVVNKKAEQLLELANNILFYGKRNIRIVQLGEMQAIALALIRKADVIVVDERITRTLVETPYSLKRVMEKRIHRKLDVNKRNLQLLEKEVKHLKLIRSTELVAVAFEEGLLDKFVVDIPDAKRELLESLLWGMKTEGCSVTEKEINDVVKFES